MPLTWKDRIKETISSGGTGTLTLGSAASGYQAFASGDDGKLFAYVIEDGTAWETGYGTYTHTGTTFARTSRTDSSTGSALNVSTSAYLFVDLISTMADGHELATQAITPGGRLTLSSGNPFADVSSSTSIYYTPCIHDIINLWDGNRWKPITFTEYTLALGTLTSGKPYDVFAYLNSGALALEMLAWTSDTARATAVTLQDGRYCKSGDKTRLLLGTFYTISTTQTQDNDAKRLLWNAYNRITRKLRIYNGTSHTYTTATFRAYNNDQPNSSIYWMQGLAGESPVLSSTVVAENSTIGVYLQAGIDQDATTSTDCNGNLAVARASTRHLIITNLIGTTSVGLHYACITQYSTATGTCTWHEGNIDGHHRC